MPSYKVRWDRTTSNDATLVQFFETSHPGCTSRTANKVGCAMIIRDPFSVFHFCFFSVFRFFLFGLRGCFCFPCVLAQLREAAMSASVPTVARRRCFKFFWQTNLGKTILTQR